LRALWAPLLALALLLPFGAGGRPGGGSSYSGSRSSSRSSSSRSSSGGSSGSYSHSSSSGLSGSYNRSSGSGSSRSYNGGSSGSSSDSSDGGSYIGDSSGSIGHGGWDLLPILLLLFFVAAGVVAAAVLVVPKYFDWQGLLRGGARGPAVRAVPGARHELARLRETTDPDFSLVLFQDFLYALFAEAHQARARGARMDQLAPYLSEQARQALCAGTQPDEVKGVIVGALRLAAARGLEPNAAQVAVEVVFESNYTDVLSGREATVFAVERWSLVRGKQARSRPPEKVRAFSCPSCGAPLTALRGNTCSYCQRVVDTGEFDWLVAKIAVLSLEPRGALFSEGEVKEVGTNLPTVFDEATLTRLQGFHRRDPAFDWDQLEARVRLVFGELQEAWSSREWTRARPYVSDRLFQSLSWWMDAYKKDGLRNVTEGGRISRIDLSRFEADRWYDAITLRVFASSLDYTIGDDGRLRAGSREERRAYTEYWTLIRGAQVRRAASTDKSCPKCGAPLKIDMAGSCEHCQARVTSGEFDWVLSMIEQDESYQG
jgi:uncharacterized Zn finger protein (UPF0148 family)